MWEKVEELLSAKTAKQAPQPAPSTHMPDRAVLQVPPISRPHYRLPAGQGHDGTPPSSEGVPPMGHPLSHRIPPVTYYYISILYNNIYIILCICLLE